MNAENFAAYLKNPTQLYQISYQELKSLVMEYPYCQNLRYLLLLKSQIDQNKDFKHNLEKAATYSFDRTFLFQQFKSAPKPLEVPQEENFILNEEVLELREMEQVEETLVHDPTGNNVKDDHQPEEEPFAAGFRQMPDEEPEFELDLEDLQLGQAPALDLLPPEESTETEPSALIADHLPLHHASIVAITSDWLKHLAKEPVKTAAKKSVTPAPLPKAALSLKAKKKPKIKLEEVKVPKKKKKKKKQTEAMAFAEKSVKDNAGIASETLANLLEEQGLYDKAIEIYERLMLLFPKNGPKYMEKIDQLKTEIKS
ncbi:MAG: hypothetical protein MRY78_08720 [Saprospiraceae bacterium]|nr:hypothetical protein [Saprospiraceae bacterium]